MCPWCTSLERHRLLWLHLERNTDLLQRQSRLLHIAPEPAITRALHAAVAPRVVTVDLLRTGVDITANLEALPFREGSFDWIYCSHVLEHVEDDAAAMAELRRVLRPTGTALVQVPVDGPRTHEQPELATPEERLAAFGQEDHVRAYGWDVVDRLESAGFVVSRVMAPDVASSDEIERCRLPIAEPLFLCHAPE